MRVLLYAKMLKETKTEETIVFFVTFLSLVAFQLGDLGPLATPMLGGRAPPNGYLCPPFKFTQITVLEHHSMTRQHTMMEKEIISLKHNSPLTFSPFFAKLLATNCCVT